MSLRHSPTVDDLMADSLIQAVMRADRVEPQALKSLLNSAALRIGAGRRRRALTVFVRSAIDRRKTPRRRMRRPPPPGPLASRARIAGRRFAAEHALMVGFFIQRPIFASAIAAILVLAGAVCFFLLPVSQFPEITPPQVVVSANYPGASAQVVADTVTTPLEEQINGVEGMTYMSSASSNDGSSTITVTFNVGYPLNIAAVDVQNRVSQAASSLPAIVNQGGVTIKKQNPNFVLIVNLTSPDRSVDSVTLSNYAYLQIVDQLKRLPGVGDVQIFGERRYSMRVWLDPDKLASLGVTAVDVQNAIAEQNVQVAAGKIGQSPAPPGTPFELQVNAAGRLSDPS